MATCHAIFQASVEGLQAASIPLILQWTLPTAVLKRETLAWGPGDTTLTVPTGCTFILVEPPATTTAVLTAKGAGGDTGWRISSTLPTPLTAGPTGSKIIGASLAVTDVRVTYV